MVRMSYNWHKTTAQGPVEVVGLAEYRFRSLNVKKLAILSVGVSAYTVRHETLMST